MMVKTENMPDCMMSEEARGQSPIGGNSSAHAVTGEMIAFFIFLFFCIVESEMYTLQLGWIMANYHVCFGTHLWTWRLRSLSCALRSLQSNWVQLQCVWICSAGSVHCVSWQYSTVNFDSLTVLYIFFLINNTICSRRTSGSAPPESRIFFALCDMDIWDNSKHRTCWLCQKIQLLFWWFWGGRHCYNDQYWPGNILGS